MRSRLYARLGLEQGDTVGSVLARHRGVGPGFGLLRIALAVLIFYYHAKWIGAAGGTDPALVEAARHSTETALNTMVTAEGGWEGWHRIGYISLVPMFFTLSGFLVAGSALRLRRTSTFLAARGLRIFPALTTEVTLSALVLGPLLTTAPHAAYFTDPVFFSYFFNIVGHVHYALPGLFLNNHASGMVNINLWTLPGEFYCYLAISACMVTGLVYSRRVFTGALIGLLLVLAPLNLFTQFDVVPGRLPTHALAVYFLAGVAAYHWCDHIPVSPALFVAAVAISSLLLLSKHTVYILPVFLVYATIAFGMIRIPRIPLIDSGDYSYGIYLYGFPICQALVTVVPALQGHKTAVFALGLAITFAFAAASWHLIEKRALRLKKLLPERWFPSAPRALTPVPEAEDRRALGTPVAG